MFESLRRSLEGRQRYNARNFEVVLAKARMHSTVGRMVNLALSYGLDVVRALKRLRARGQEWRRRLAARGRPVAIPSRSPAFPPVGDTARVFVRPFLLFVAEDSIPQCRAYRVRDKARHFERLGIAVEVVSCWDPQVAYRRLASAQAVLFYRVAALPEALPLLREARRLGIPSAWEVDDLIFDAQEYARHPYFLRCSEESAKELLRGARLFAEAMTYVDQGVASTSPLLGALAKHIKGPIHLVENGLSEELLAVSATVSAEKRHQAKVDDDTLRIGYGSGTLTHDDDYALVGRALVRLLQKHSNVRLVVMGHLELPSALDPFQGNVIRIPFASTEVYYRAVASLDVNLAPLAPMPFNDAKSNIKWLEAAIFEVPTVASPSEPFRRAIESGVNGFLATTEQEWFEALDALVTRGERRREMGRAARAAALRLYSPEHIAREQVLPLARSLGLVAPDAQGSFAESSAGPAVNPGNPDPSSLQSPLWSPTVSVPRKPRVASVNVYFAPLSYGGATVVAEEMAKLLAARHGWEVSVFAGNVDDALPDGFVTRYETAGLPVYSFRLPRAPIEPLSYRNDTARAAFSDFLEATRPDVVHFHSIQFLGAGLLEECRARGIPFAVTLHDAWWLCARQFRYLHEEGRRCEHRPITPLRCLECKADRVAFIERTAYLKGTLAQADRLLAPSRFQGALYEDNGFDPARIVVNENGVVAPKRERRRTQRASPGNVVFAYLGGPSKLKGYHFVKDAFTRLESSDYTLVLTNCDLKLGLATELGRDFQCRGEIVVAPPFDQASIDDFFDGVDVLLAPSQWDECFGLVVREALARDVWVIASDAGALPEAIAPGENGRVFPRDDRDAFKAAIEDCLRHPERFREYANPHRAEVRYFADQASDLHSHLSRLVRRP